MKTIKLGNTGKKVPAVAVGCMRLTSLSQAETANFINFAMDKEANFFDHADIYGDGECETLFAQAIGMNATVREKMILQSKCGIIPGKTFDFSKAHILFSVEKILKRLRTEYLDILLLHRPDALMEPEEVAEAFEELHNKGQVRHFGVSNQNPMQISLLQKYVKQPLIVNQLQLSVTNANMISNGLHVNMLDDAAINRDGSVLDFCRLHDITIQTWSPFQYGFFEGVFLDNPKFPKLNEKINEIAAEYSVTNTAIAAAWILRHPAAMQLVTGTMNTQRLEDCINAADITLTREQWYQIWMAAGNVLP
ncbi:MAG: aldo/keto reductase [Spirochaetaceae bacterium]|jgi:predicted oxidoreductase|nr:aldo/keto reductase [Spirochaetaceae bacterium]